MTLVVCRSLPGSGHGGSDLRARAVVRALTRFGRVDVFGLVDSAAPPPAPPGVGVWRTSGIPGLAGGAAPETGGTPGGDGHWLGRRDGHPSDAWFDEGAMRVLRGLLTEHRPEIVVVEHLWLHRYLEPLADSGAQVVLDAQNVEAAVHEEIADASGNPVANLLARRTAALEARAVRLVDQVWCPSARDAQLMDARFPSCAPTRVVPNTVAHDRYHVARPGGRVRVLYAGDYLYPPNAAAATRLLEEIFPLVVAKRPDAQLVLMGRNPGANLRAAADGDQVVVTGAVEDARPYFAAATALVVPLHEGGGTRLKVLEAWASGLPVVSSAKGVEGLDLVAGTHYLRAESAREISSAVVDLASDMAAWDALAAGGRRLVADRYSDAAAARAVGGALQALSTSRSRHPVSTPADTDEQNVDVSATGATS